MYAGGFKGALAVAYVKCRRPLTETRLSKVFRRISALFSEKGVLTQVVRPDFFVSLRQVKSACIHMLINVSAGRRICEQMLNELLCYLAATRQIGEAIARVGIRAGDEEFIAVLLASDEEEAKEALKTLLKEVEGLERPLNLLRPNHEKLALVYDISEKELKSVSSSSLDEALEKLVLERIATFTIE